MLENPVTNNESGEQKLFEYAVPYNHLIQVRARAKMRILSGVILLVTAAFFALFGVVALTSKAEDFAVAIFFGFAVFSLGAGIFSLMLMKPSEKHKDKNVNFIFFNYGMHVTSEAGFGRKLGDTKCLYNRYGNKQFVNNIIEMSDIFLFKVYKGTLNGMPQYKKYYLPKDVVESKGETEKLKELLVAQKQNMYKVNEKAFISKK